jgi:hypothetical protein
VSIFLKEQDLFRFETPGAEIIPVIYALQGRNTVHLIVNMQDYILSRCRPGIPSLYFFALREGMRDSANELFEWNTRQTVRKNRCFNNGLGSVEE